MIFKENIISYELTCKKETQNDQQKTKPKIHSLFLADRHRIKLCNKEIMIKTITQKSGLKETSAVHHHVTELKLLKMQNKIGYFFISLFFAVAIHSTLG